MYGSVAAYLFIVKTAIGSEKRVADEMQARLMGSGSLSRIQENIFAILHPTGMRGYVMVESNALHHVEKLIGRSGGRDPKARRGLNQTPLKNAKNSAFSEKHLSKIFYHTSNQRLLPAVSKLDVLSKSSLALSRERKLV